jgi:hypothetical protein
MSTAKFSSLGEVTTIVKDTDLSAPSVSAMTVDAGVYKLGVITKNKVSILYLIDVTNADHRFRLTTKQLVFLRLDRGGNPEAFSDSFISHPKGDFFKTIFLEGEETGKTMEQVLLKVTKQLKLRNFQVSDKDAALYHDVCYSGLDKYREDMATLKYDWRADNDEATTDAYYTSRRNFRNALHRTSLNPGAAIDSNLELVPAFTLAWGA